MKVFPYRWFYPDFPIQLEKEFKTLTHGQPSDEISLFNNLRSTFERLTKDFTIDVLHGSSHQVTFKSKYPWAPIKKPARCELCDLMVVTFRTNPLRIRLTFLQNKADKIIGNLPLTFSADMLQWELLSEKPQVCGISPFNPPPNMLSEALLPSVGTFGVFYRDTNSDYNMAYAIANVLGPIKKGKSQKRKLKYIGNRGEIRTISGYNEITSTSTLAEFGHHLARMRIGTPIDGTPVGGESQEYRVKLRKWLFNMVKERISFHDSAENIHQYSFAHSIQNDPLGISVAREFVGLLSEYYHMNIDDDKQQANSNNGPSIILIKTDGEMLRGVDVS